MVVEHGGSTERHTTLSCSLAPFKAGLGGLQKEFIGGLGEEAEIRVIWETAGAVLGPGVLSVGQLRVLAPGSDGALDALGEVGKGRVVASPPEAADVGLGEALVGLAN